MTAPVYVTAVVTAQAVEAVVLAGYVDQTQGADHAHANQAVLDLIQEAFTTALKASYDAAAAASHTHSNKATLDAIQEAFTTALKASYDAAAAASHSHSNKATLDAIQEAFTTALKASYDAAVTASHSHKVFIAQYQKTQGTNGGTNISGWQTIVLNASKSDSGTGITLNDTNGQITLPAGSYRFRGYCGSSGNAGAMRSGVYNVTAGAWLFDYESSQSQVLVSASGNVFSRFESVLVTVASTTVIDLRVYLANVVANFGLGRAVGVGVETYDEIVIERVA